MNRAALLIVFAASPCAFAGSPPGAARSPQTQTGMTAEQAAVSRDLVAASRSRVGFLTSARVPRSMSLKVDQLHSSAVAALEETTTGSDAQNLATRKGGQHVLSRAPLPTNMIRFTAYEPTRDAQDGFAYQLVRTQGGTSWSRALAVSKGIAKLLWSKWINTDGVFRFANRTMTKTMTKIELDGKSVPAWSWLVEKETKRGLTPSTGADARVIRYAVTPDSAIVKLTSEEALRVKAEATK